VIESSTRVRPLARKSREPEVSRDFRAGKALAKRLARRIGFNKTRARGGLLPKASEQRRLESTSLIGDRISLPALEFQGLVQPTRQQSPLRAMPVAPGTCPEQRLWPNSDGVSPPLPDRNDLCRGRPGQLWSHQDPGAPHWAGVPPDDSPGSYCVPPRPALRRADRAGRAREQSVPKHAGARQSRRQNRRPKSVLFFSNL
jgi:hypothetical protein